MTYKIKFTDGTDFNPALGKIVCVGRNYAEHAKELNNPVPAEPILFIKPESSVVSLNSAFEIPATDCHYECEIAVLIGETLSSAHETQVAQAILGLGLALDLTRRELQSKLKEKAYPWEIAKSFDGACPLSDFVPITEFSDLSALSFSLHVNDELKQSGESSDMLNPILPLIAHMSQFFTLKPGDVILTGTPKGVGRLNKGDQLRFSLMDKLNLESTAI